ncbi:MAG: Chromosome (plasmid) partitioning protein ParB [Ignavibacteriae bacterium]|nr:MAG: Chromosome (plasmid) partitioning protein ParB [Ignavibacteriota bacterium]
MSKIKGGLGKGLAALIGPVEGETQPVEQKIDKKVETVVRETEGIVLIDIEKIRPNPFQPRADFDEKALDELKKSILEKGIIQPITVRRKEDYFELIAGERRVRAATDAGMNKIPAYIIEVKSDEEMLELALIENLQREYLNPIEIAISYQRLITECNLTYEQVAERIGKDRTTVINFIRLLRLPEPIQKALRENKISAGHARMLVSLPDEKTQFKIFNKIIKNDLNVRQVERLVRDINKKPEIKIKENQEVKGTSLIDIEQKLRQLLGTKVNINPKKDGKGEIIIEFYSNEDLDRLIELIMNLKNNI